MSLTVTVYVKLVEKEYVDVVSSKYDDMLSYSQTALTYYDNITSAIIGTIHLMEVDLERFKDQKNTTTYTEMEMKYKDMQDKLAEIRSCNSIFDKCQYYCKYNHIEYIPKRVEFNKEE